MPSRWGVRVGALNSDVRDMAGDEICRRGLRGCDIHDDGGGWRLHGGEEWPGKMDRSGPRRGNGGEGGGKREPPRENLTHVKSHCG